MKERIGAKDYVEICCLPLDHSILQPTRNLMELQRHNPNPQLKDAVAHCWINEKKHMVLLDDRLLILGFGYEIEENFPLKGLSLIDDGKQCNIVHFTYPSHH